MSDLIRRDEILAKECCGRISANDVRQAPAVDAVEVVRCGECKYWGSPTVNQEAICLHWSSYYGSIRTMDYQYCSSGERREDSAVD